MARGADAASRTLLRSIATKHPVANWFYGGAVTALGEAARATDDAARRSLDTDHQEGNAVPNIGRPLADFSRVTSSSMTSQCSASNPFSMRTMSTTIQFAG
jgi:hypothetical protein